MIEIMNAVDAKVEYFNKDGFPGGERYVVTFDNGYGASIICNEGSYGGKVGLWELAVLHKSIKGYDLCYSTPITNDVIGWLSPKAVGNLVADIMALESNDSCDHGHIDWDNPWNEDEEELVN